MSRSFGLDALTALVAFKNAVERFRDDILNEDLARDCAIKAWHLCDYAFKELDSKSQFYKLKNLKKHVKDCCPELAYLQDVCNASKHVEITYPSNIDETNHYRGDFCPKDFDSRDFDTSRLEIKLSDDQTIPYIYVVDRAVDFWSKFFDDYELS